MPKTFFIADPHFGDDRIRKYENRPFATVQAMDAEMIARWNQVVSQEDAVYVLGDFGGSGQEARILAQLNGTKYLVKGNHDLETNDRYRSFGFQEVYDHPIILDGFWILSHDSLYVNTNMPYANLFGHVHNSPVIRDYSPQHFCVSAERIHYTPIDFTQIKQTIAEAANHAQ